MNVQITRENRPGGRDIRRVWSGLGILLAFLLCPAFVWAQQETGQVNGTVKDPSGAVIAGATVTAEALGTRTKRTTTTGSDGGFVLPSLQPGVYEVTVEASGFSTRKQQVQVTVGGKVGVDFAMTVGGGDTIVEVVAESGVVVNTENQTVGNVVVEKQLRELPTITRNPFDLVGLSGNANPDVQSGRGAGFAINGQRSASTNILLDGADNNNTFTASVGQNTPLDSLQEFSVLTSNFSAEFGRAAGAIVNSATKSGTNEFHGTAYEYNRISALASNDFDSSSNQLSKGVFTRNQFGFSVGGPIFKDKLFFFANPEWIRVRSSQNVIFTVPTPELIARSAPATQQFFQAFPLANAINGRVFTRAEIPGQVANGPFSQLPASLPVFGYASVPIPTDAGGGSPQNTIFGANRVDYNLSEKTSLYVRYAFENIDNFAGTISASPYRGFNTGQTNFNNNILGSVTHTFSPRLTLQSKLVYNRLTNQQPLNGPSTPTLFLTGSVPGLGGNPYTFPGYTPNSPGNAIPFGGPQNLIQTYHDASYVLGKHELRFGGNYIRINDNRTFGAFQNAVATLGNTIGQGLDNFVRGQLQSFQVAFDPKGAFPGDTIQFPVTQPDGLFARNFRFNDYSFYANDTYRLRSGLTLTLGVRYEYYGVPYNKDRNLDANFYLGSGANRFEQIRNGRVFRSQESPIGTLWNPDRNNFAPRVGIAWDVFGDGKTSVRGGYGISYERNFGNVTFNIIQNPPNYFVTGIVAGQPGFATIPLSSNNLGPFAGAGTRTLPASTLRAVDPNIKTAYSHFWSASVQQQLFKNLVVSVDYTGSKGVNLYSIANINRFASGQVLLGDPGPTRLNRQYGNINWRAADGDSIYHGVTIGFDSQNLGRTGLFFTARYTYSKAIDNLSSTFSDGTIGNFVLGYTDAFNPRLDRGPADFDVRHRFVTSGVWEIPYAKGTTGWKKQALDGWQLNYILNIRTGFPFSVFDSTNAFSIAARLREISPITRSGSDNPTPTDVPNQFKYIDLRSLSAGFGSFFNPISETNDFPPYPSNMTGRNSFRGPGFWNLDASVAKRININERFTVQLRAEAFNLFNHANLFIDGNNVDVAAFDFVPARRLGRRQVQLAARFIF